MTALPKVYHEQIPLDDLDHIEDEQLRAMVETWRQWARAAKRPGEGSCRLPVWDSAFAMEFPLLAERCYLYDLTDGRVTAKFIGEQARDMIGLPGTSGDLYDLFPRANVYDVHTRILKCAECGKPNHCKKSMSWNPGREYLDYEVVFLPFRSKPEAEHCDTVYCAQSFYSHFT